jgi:hypothetical protein
LINDLVNKYGDIKTILTIEELLQPSDQTRSKGIPRPQNTWLLYRKDISKGINKANITSIVGRTSKVASKYCFKVGKRILAEIIIN